MTSLERAVETGVSGVYGLDPGKLGELGTLARRAGLAFHRVELSGAPQKPAILAALSRELRFPDWFGDNWDALQDALCDLSWLPESRGVVLLVEGTDAVGAAAPAALDTLLGVLRDAAAFWEEEGRPFLVLLAGATRPGLRRLR